MTEVRQGESMLHIQIWEAGYLASWERVANEDAFSGVDIVVRRAYAHDRSLYFGEPRTADSLLSTRVSRVAGPEWSVPPTSSLSEFQGGEVSAFHLGFVLVSGLFAGSELAVAIGDGGSIIWDVERSPDIAGGMRCSTRDFLAYTAGQLSLDSFVEPVTFDGELGSILVFTDLFDSIPARDAVAEARGTLSAFIRWVEILEAVDVDGWARSLR